MADVKGAAAVTLATALYAPRSIALIGASTDPIKASSRPLGFLRASGYAGDVYPVNRRGGTFDGEHVYQSVTDLPRTPDHAFIMTPTAAVLDAVRDCAAMGVSVATVLAGGFGEIGPEGLAMQEELLEVASASGLRLLGPNSLGLVNNSNGLRLTANAAFAENDLPQGGLFVASQSGSMIGALLSRGAARGIGFSKLVSVGAEMDLSIGELCGATLDDPDVTGYLLFLETIRHAADLREFAAGAAERGKPVLAYKLGKSEMAAQLAASHTGALAGEDDVASAFLADTGIVRVHTLEALLEGAPLVARTPTRTPGRRPAVGVVTTTGGGAAMVVDQLGTHGTRVVPPSDETLRLMAEAGAVVEPGLITDLTLAGTRPEVMRAALEVLTVAPEFDLILAVAGSSARHSPGLVVEPIIDVATRPGTHPVATFLVPDAPEALAMLSAAGVPSFRTPEACADAIAASLNRDAPRRQASAAAPLSASVLIDEAESYAVLQSAGVPVAPFAVLDVTDEPLSLPGTLAYPVAVKALSDQLAHKSDVGGVRLNIGTDADLDAAARTIRTDVLAGAGTGVDRLLVQQMKRGVGEVLLGYRIDPEMGPLVLVAAGGTRAEVYADRSIRMAPVNHDTARDMLDEVAAMEIFRGFRGAEVGDLDAVVEAVVGLSQLCHRPDVVEAEINPLMVFGQGAGVVAVDAAVRVRSVEVAGDSVTREESQIHA